MVMCFVPDCKHYSERQICKFFRFPRDNTLKEKWIQQIRRADKFPTLHSLVCSCHFLNADRNNLPTIFDNDKIQEILFKSEDKKEQDFSQTLENSLIPNLPSTSSTSSCVQKAQIPQGEMISFHHKRIYVEVPETLIESIKVENASNLEGSSKKRRQHLKMDHTYCLSQIKEQENLEEEQKNVQQELEAMEENVQVLVDRVHHLQETVSDLSKRKLISDNVVAFLENSYSDILYNIIKNK